MSDYKLTYFNFRGRGETIRLIFAVAGVPYEDIRFEWDPPEQTEWNKIKPNTPFGQVPMLEFDGHKFCQSLSIGRHLAIKYNLAGRTDLDKLRADMIVEYMEDILCKIDVFLMEENQARKDEQKKKFLEVDLPTYLDNFEKLLKENNNGDGYFVGNELTWADLATSVFIGHLGYEELGVTQFDGHPKLNALAKRVESLPRVAEWIARRPLTRL